MTKCPEKSRAVQLRIVRQTERLDEVLAFYRDGLGLAEIGGFRCHDGYDGVAWTPPTLSLRPQVSVAPGHLPRWLQPPSVSCT